MKTKKTGFMKKNFTQFVQLLLLFIITALQAQVWEPVGNSSGISNSTVGRLTLVNSSLDDLVVGYYDVTTAKGAVQKFNGTEWEYVGSSSGITSGVANYNSTVVDHNGVIYFSNQAGWPGSGLEVQKFENGNWTSLPNATDASINYMTSAIGPDNTLYVVSGENSGTIKKYENGTWVQVGTSGFFGGVPFYVDMEISTDGIIYLSFNNNSYLHVYKNSTDASSSTVWEPVGGNVNLASAVNSENYNSAIALDGNNNLYVVYISPSSQNNRLNVKKWDGNSWIQLGPENFSDTRVQHTSIVIGTNNKIYVAASIFENTNLLRNYVTSYNETTNTWSQVGTGFASEDQATNNSLAIDNSGDIYLAFMDSGFGKLSVKKLDLEQVAAASVEITTLDGGAPEITTDNGTIQLKAIVSPTEASQNVIWSITEGSTFATIDQTGLVTATASDHTITVKAASAENSSIFDTLQISISNQDSDIPAQSMTLKVKNGRFADLFSIGSSLELEAAVLPAEADQIFSWQVVEGTSVTVDQNGILTSVTEGRSIVRATHVDGTLYKEIEANVYNSGCTQGNFVGYTEFGYSITNHIWSGADDFIVPQGTRFAPKRLRLYLISNPSMQVQEVTFNFRKNQNNTPREIITSIEELIPVSQTVEYVIDGGFENNTVYLVEFDLPSDVYFDEGTYWIDPQVVSVDDSNVYWALTYSGGIGNSYHVDPHDGNGWIALGGGGYNALFEITGVCTSSPVVVTTVNGGNAEINVGETLALQATVNAGVSSNAVSWSVIEGNNYASVNDNGIVTGIRQGTATVRATLIENPDYYGDFIVTILNPDACNQSVTSEDFTDGFIFGGDNNIRLAVDVDVPENTTFTIDNVVLSLVNYAETITLEFYTDNNGLPGELITAVPAQVIDNRVTDSNFGYYLHQYTLKLDDLLALTTGKYWMEVKSDAVAWEATTEHITGLPAAFYSDANGAWTTSSSGSDLVYEINGGCTATLGVSETNENNSISYYPNPVDDYLNITSQKNIREIKIYSLVGQITDSVKGSGKTNKVNLSKFASGVYLLQVIFEDRNTQTIKIIKK